MTQPKKLPAKPGWNDLPPRDWAEREAYRIALQVRELRKPHSAQWLSERTAALGYQINRALISDLELGRRRYVSTAELSVLAWALRVPPIRLLYPDLPDGPVEIIPNRTVSSIDALTWFSGETLFLPELDTAKADDEAQWLRDVEAARQISDGARLVELSRERLRQQSRISSLTKTAARLRNSGDPEGSSFADSLMAEIIAAEKLLEQINEALRGRPSTFPPVADAVVNDDGR
ncbi:hypothetical protein ACP6C7_04090 [Mycolicibacterium septicum]|uniref:DNA-binding protein n=1 Tax=Mycolicibacterium septicum TaxID=98668 RepID=A0ABW9LRD4_9MYCO